MKKFIQITIFFMLLVSIDISAQKRFMLRGRARTYPRPVMKTNVRLSWYKYQVLQKQRSRQSSFEAKAQFAQSKHKTPLMLPRIHTINTRTNQNPDTFAIKIDSVFKLPPVITSQTPLDTTMVHWVVQRRLIRNEHNVRSQVTDRIKRHQHHHKETQHKKETRIHPAER